MKKLLAAIDQIINDPEVDDGDAGNWEDLKWTLESGLNAQSSFAGMDTYSRELLAPFAKADLVVKEEATTHLNINWLF